MAAEVLVVVESWLQFISLNSRRSSDNHICINSGSGEDNGCGSRTRISNSFVVVVEVVVVVVVVQGGGGEGAAAVVLMVVVVSVTAVLATVAAVQH